MEWQNQHWLMCGRARDVKGRRGAGHLVGQRFGLSVEEQRGEARADGSGRKDLGIFSGDNIFALQIGLHVRLLRGRQAERGKNTCQRDPRAKGHDLGSVCVKSAEDFSSLWSLSRTHTTCKDTTIGCDLQDTTTLSPFLFILRSASIYSKEVYKTNFCVVNSRVNYA